MIDTAAERALLALMADLDNASSLYGAPSPDARARIFAFMDAPSDETWCAARSIIVNGERLVTLWQAVLAVYVDHSFVVTPTPEMAATALRAAVRGEIARRSS